MKRSSGKNKMSPKITFGLLAILGVITLVLGFASLSQAINAPRDIQRAARQELLSNPTHQGNLGGSSLPGENEQRLQKLDTDEDGLSDYDELYLYATSPYLPDSDSDGFSDSQEVESGNDPNCPAGQNCRSPIDESEIQTFQEDLFVDLKPSEEIQDAPNALPDLSNLSAQEIRQILLENGQLTQEQLSEIDDETLVKAYQEVLSQSIEEN